MHAPQSGRMDPALKTVVADSPADPAIGDEEIARRVAAGHAAGRRAGPAQFLRRLDALEARLREAHAHVAVSIDPKLGLSYAGEWLLDNFYLVNQAVRQVRQDLPKGFYRELPKLDASGEHSLPRIYALARELTASSEFYLDPDRMRRFVVAYQTVTPLTMGELWGLPTMLRLATLERLARAATALVEQAEGGSNPSGAEQPVQADGHPSIVANSILSLRALDIEDWQDFFESVSRAESILRRDPARVYAHMDFETRDRYRKVVEHLARATGHPEESVAQLAVDLAVELGGRPIEGADTTVARPSGEMRQPREEPRRPKTTADPLPREPRGRMPERSEPPSTKTNHVGFFLLDRGRPLLERRLGYSPSLRTRMRRGVKARALGIYLGAIGLLTLLIMVGVGWLSVASGGSVLQVVVAAVLTLVPAATIAVSLVHSIIPRLVAPRLLPKMDFREGIPREFSALVAIPALITGPEEVRSLMGQLEQHYLGTLDANLHFALLTDFGDAPLEHMPEDELLLAEAREGIRALNRKYRNGRRECFHLFHRSREWNPQEGVWMGWERKRGKLVELSELLSVGKRSRHVQTHVGRPLPRVRFVITLDADSVLTRGGTRRLVATLAHPLNQAEFDPRSGALRSGYTVLQPRVRVKPTSVRRSILTRIFAGDAGLDLYTQAVSDTYQDLFGEGIFVGKGIMDVAAFRRSLAGRVPENALLSHDLFEGVVGRAGLVSDVVVLEDFPDQYLGYEQRLHRWIRGDWQLLPWLLPRVPAEGGGKIRNDFSVLDRWKILDNLRRSLLAPSMLGLLAAGWTWLPGPALIWTGLAILAPGASLLAGMAQGIRLRRPIPHSVFTWRPPWADLVRWVFALAFLPFEALLALDAIGTTLVRLAFTRRRLLEWTPAAHIARSLGRRAGSALTWRRMALALTLALALVLLTAWVNPASLLLASPFALAWLVSPQIALLISRRMRAIQPRLTPMQRAELGSIARRTWLFFERFVGPEDHWLPPDHFQETPRGQVAHRTSPTNIGFLLLSSLAASDMGYVSLMGLELRLGSTFDSLEALERHRGHYFNWYDTQTLAPLAPRYVSTVDSGNLAASLMTVSQACETMPEARIFPWQRWQGLLDTLAVLGEGIPDGGSAAAAVRGELAEIRRRTLAVEAAPDRWADLVVALSGTELSKLDQLLRQMIEVNPHALTPHALSGLRLSSERVRHHLMSMRRELDLLLPWADLVAHPPELFSGPESDPLMLGAWRSMREAFPTSPRLREVPDVCRTGEAIAQSLRALIQGHAQDLQKGPDDVRLVREAEEWCDRADTALQGARLAAEALMLGFQKVGARAEVLVHAMDFSFLFDKRRQVFHIGYNLQAGKLDDHHYDLLASEARLASLVAIAKRDVPMSHWLHLGRPMARADDSLVLLSWSGTMFEYLMPLLLERSYPGTLLEQSARAAVKLQIEYARSTKMPWGISESGYYAFDAGSSYQYRAFGIPGLGLKRGLDDDRVIAPYASLMAVSLAPTEAITNLRQLRRMGMLAEFGFFEAIDFTPSRLPLGETQARVQSYMSHHHGMSLVAIANAMQADIMVQRFHSDPRIRSVELLLQEQLPVHVPVVAVEDRVATPARAIRRKVSLTPWRSAVRTPTPQAHLLSNGRYTVVITAAGSGYSEWRGTALTRWRADPTLDDWGTWIYIKDHDNGNLWSAGFQPTATASARQGVLFFPYKAEFHREQDGLALRMEVAVAADDDVEIRHLILTNNSDLTRRLTVTSYAEVVLASQAEDRRHPAFNKLFIESEFHPELNALIFHRRARSADEPPLHLVHMLVANSAQRGPVAHESERARFLGRGRSPRSPLCLLGPGAALTGSTGATLDPIMALGQEIEIPPRATVRLAFVTMASETREEGLLLAGRYQAMSAIDRAFGRARTEVEAELAEQSLSTADLECLDQLLSALLYPSAKVRSEEETLAANRKGQPGLWAFGVSGDYPLLLVHLNSEDETPLVRDVLRAHAFIRRRGVQSDLVLLLQKESGYGQELQGDLFRLIVRMQLAPWLNQRGGIFILSSDQMAGEDRTLLETAARVVLDGSRGTLAGQLARPFVQRRHLPAFVPTLGSPEEIEPTPALARPTTLMFDNGRGGFSPDGSEYQIYLRPGERTPVPWINVVANPDFGFVVSETGAGFTWAENSSENRLTPWANDPVRDSPGEALYLRDEETAATWSPTPMPAPASAPYLVRHGAGYSIFEHQSHGLRQSLRLFVVPDAPAKVIALRLENLWTRPRRLTATYYAQWVLGTDTEVTSQYLVPEYEPEANMLLAHNPYNMDFGGRYAFLAACQRPHGLTADRTEFLGRMGDVQSPAGLTRVGLAGAVRAGLDPCAALQLHVELKPGESKEIFFVLGQAAQREEAVRLARRYGQPAEMEVAWGATQSLWNEMLGGVTVRTPDPSMDLMLNRWLLYQTLSCRMWGRSALYQSSGAFGFRDQLQDAMALVHAAPQLAREHLLQAARHQFEEGDVLHWWHPPLGRGDRTRCSDDLLWLPFVTAHYVEATGDEAILGEHVPFLRGAPLKEGEHQHYGLYAGTAEKASLFDHCQRALERGMTSGSHGLPLIGSGDWNDGLNRIGIDGKGESVWLGWFICATLTRFAELCERLGRADEAAGYRARAAQFGSAIESAGWDGEWYRRGYYDDGQPLGSSHDDEWQIDAVAQSWSVLSGAADPDRATQAMRAVQTRLVIAKERLVLLATPPFDKTARDPGYLKGYPPGVRENGGAYQHAAMWTAWAFLKLGWAEEAHALLHMLNPINLADAAGGVSRYRAEPYVLAADISSEPPHVGRAGWTWYTGSAGWMYRLGLEGILGLQRMGNALRFAPRIPGDWRGFQMRYRFGRSIYQIEVTNPEGAGRAVHEVRLDGQVVRDGMIPLRDDGTPHQVTVLMR